MSLARVGKQSASTAAYHVGAQVWVPVKGAQDLTGKRGAGRWVKGRVTSISTDRNGINIIEVQTEEMQELALKASDCPLQNDRDDTVDDLVKSDFLHEPGCEFCVVSAVTLMTLTGTATTEQSLTHAGSCKLCESGIPWT